MRFKCFFVSKNHIITLKNNTKGALTLLLVISRILLEGHVGMVGLGAEWLVLGPTSSLGKLDGFAR